MSDKDQTIVSAQGAANVPGAPVPESKSNTRPLLIIGGIGCALLLCVVLLVGGGVYFGRDQLEGFVSGLGTDENTPTPPPTEVIDTPTLAATELPTAQVEETTTVEMTPTPEEVVEPEMTATVTEAPAEPKIGNITFALGATEDYEPIDPGTEFEGEVTEVHALFEYSGFSPEYTWARVWYLDGTEMLRSSEPWSGVTEGIFDYFINAGGQPLSPGEWVLELYVEDELLATASFVIVGDEEVTEVATATATGTDQTIASLQTATPQLSATSTPSPTPRPASRTYRLAFTKWDGGKHLLYVGDTAGGSEQFIIGRAAGPSWTPDGQYIFIYGEEGVDRQEIDGNEYVFAKVANGIVRIDAAPVPTSIDQVRLYQGPGWNEGTARWANVSPDGQMVAFDARPGGDYRIYFLGTDENQQFRFEIIGEQGDWSPDSQKVVYRSGRDGKTGIWISNRDDSGHTLISNNGSDSFPAWSPDGQTIVFHREVDGNVDLYAMNTDGTNVRRLTEASGPDTLPEFTPGGEIIFRSTRSGSWGVWKMNADGSNPVEIYPNAGVGPDWSFSRMSVLP